MSWLVYGAVAYVVYRLAKGADLLGGGSTTAKSKATAKPAAKKKKKKKRQRKKSRAADRDEAAEALPAHEVLGVAANASQAEIRQAYQELMRKYHPDRVANAADELRALAEQRSKEINAAYERMMKHAEA